MLVSMTTLLALRLAEKILQLDDLPRWRTDFRRTGKSLVVTNGCFDLLHVGHVTLLEAARNLGGALLVGVNGDASVRQLKGEGRPINTERDRSLVVAALAVVDGVCVFTEMKAARFLTLAEPDIYVKGGDYTPQTLDPEERAVLERIRSKIVILPFVPGKSTTGLIEKLANR
jgi:rfaE bifunctional protein nucleotidyltransferase chain/domain